MFLHNEHLRMITFSIGICFIVCNIFIIMVNGHGMLLDPVGRASRWRFNETAPANFDDSASYCGGISTQWSLHNGKCGLCGDDYGLEKPRPHEYGGRYGEGLIVKAYAVGDSVEASVMITANHLGHFYFDICNMDEEDESEECFQRNKLKLVSGEDKYTISSQHLGWYNVSLLLPMELNCKHCILRWTYRAGNMWGFCDDGSGRLGCGNQEHYRSCADIAIVREDELSEHDPAISGIIFDLDFPAESKLNKIHGRLQHKGNST